MGNSACCQDNSMNQFDMPEVTMQRPILSTILKYMETHPTIHQILQESTCVQRKIVKAKKSQIRNYQQYKREEGIYIGEDLQKTNNKKNGYAVMLYDTGYYYEGEWKDGLKSGKGIYISEEGNYYYGQWANDLAHGVGIYESRLPKTMYDGQWQAGMKNGQGIEKYQDGSVYVGNFLNGMKNGKGKITYQDGTEYQGQFIENRIEGVGTFKGKKHAYVGQWKNGKMHGAGKSQWKNSNNEIIAKYVGEYSNGIKQGFGQYTDSKGNVYKAIWFNGEINSNGPVLMEQSKETMLF